MTNKVLNGQTYLCALPYVVVKKAATRRMMFCRHMLKCCSFIAHLRFYRRDICLVKKISAVHILK